MTQPNGWRRTTILYNLVSISSLLSLLSLLLPFVAADVPAYLPVMTPQLRASFKAKVKEMFYHGYDNYMAHAFPHDELKPISATWTDTLAELGNAQRKQGSTYQGVAMTLIDSLSTLAVLGNATEFSRAVRWISTHVSFDVDVRVNVFEANIRLLGGLLSAHVLASDKRLGLMPDYDGSLLELSVDLGHRLLTAFKSDSDLPYAWVNLRNGVEHGETKDQCTAGVGTLLLEFGMLSHLSGDTRFFDAAHTALMKLWTMKSSIGLLGNTFDRDTAQWKNNNAGIGAGVDSFYEYLLKAHVMFGNSKYYEMFMHTYQAVNKHLKSGNWYVEGNMATGHHTHVQFNSLQAFWPGMQVLLGDLPSAIATQDAFFSIWRRYGALPERYILNSGDIHSSERYYPLRPEFVESTYFLYKATRSDLYLWMGEYVYSSLYNHTRVENGFASLHNVANKEKSDHMPSFFLAETCKYLYLLFDDDNFAHSTDYMFTTEGHLFPIDYEMQQRFGDTSKYVFERKQRPKIRPAMVNGQCPALPPDTRASDRWKAYIEGKLTDTSTSSSGTKNAPNPNTDRNGVPMLTKDQQQPHAAPVVPQDGSVLQYGDFAVHVGEGSFHVKHTDGGVLDIRNLGTPMIEMVDNHKQKVKAVVLNPTRGVLTYTVAIPKQHDPHITTTTALACSGESFDAVGAFFGPTPDTAWSTKNGAPPACGTSDTPACDGWSEWMDAHIVEAESDTMCEPAHNAAKLKGNVALIARGKCTFLDKVLHAQAAGAVGVIMGNVIDANNMFMMGDDGTGRRVSIPSVMVTASTYQRLRSCVNQHSATVNTLMSAAPSSSSKASLPLHLPVQLARSSTPPSPHKSLTISNTDATAASTPNAQTEVSTSSDTPNQSLPIVSGGPAQFQVRTQGGWVLEVERKGDAYVLRLF